MKKLLFQIFAAFLLPLSLQAQGNDVQRLFSRFKNVASFDHTYPREKVYLHLDNNAYFEGETLWFKAYVVRASSLQPARLSRVLYVDLLNSAGSLMERKLLRIDSLGQANGQFSLDLPVRSGFYEIRAFTREMLNWGAQSCFSRVVPVFERKKEGGAEAADLIRPESESDLPPGHPRKFNFSTAEGFEVSFYPESGRRAAGLDQRVAFRITDQRGNPLTGDTLNVYADDGSVVATAISLHEGMGSFQIPATFSGTGYACVGSGVAAKKFPLPQPDPAVKYTLTAQPETDGVGLTIGGSDAGGGLLGLSITCRGAACYLDTLTVGRGVVETFIPATSLHDGVNRIDLFDTNGQSLCSRLVWKNPSTRQLSLSVRQNAAEYAPFSPVALDMRLNDGAGKGVGGTTFSLAVREAGGELVRPDSTTDALTDLLLSSELRGYVASPEYYFQKNDAYHRLMLDLLLMVQGWSASDFPTMCGRDSFQLKYPIEDRLTISGRVIRDNSKSQPYPGLALRLRMFSKTDGGLSADAVTGADGRFAFASNVDFEGDWIAQFSTRDADNGRRKWSRILLDRTIESQPRSFAPQELSPLPPLPMSAAQAKPQTFEWQDTIPQTLSTTLSEAVVTGRGQYRGFTGDRFSYNGGEKGGMKNADFYYNVGREVEKVKDEGGYPGTIWEFLPKLNSKLSTKTLEEAMESRDAPEISAGVKPGITNLTKTNGGDTTDVGLSYLIYYGANRAVCFIDNQIAIPYEGLMADEVKSVLIMTKRENWLKYVPASAYTELAGSNIDFAVFIYTRPDMYLFATKRGFEKRVISGYSLPASFYNPDYRRADKPDASDVRRTLYWNPSVRTDAEGRASAVFFSNSLKGQKIIVNARGITADGRVVSYGY